MYILFDDANADALVASTYKDSLLKFFIKYRVKTYNMESIRDEFDFDPLHPVTMNDYEELLEYFSFSIKEVKLI